ncbi:hypothetical protein CBR_g12542 [Chara braunii]|uniref:Integrase catalytic domain-containing protein n=1 Tax=Chara braunii TaxID=69332 RepID=A0A388JSK9_CHABU|nr:hypothetical protein CBR_g12542 [Chara braunii]|eukprot:GBG60804.1 hypothetical protein CBR_g12542 [Chara braunii]
MPRDTEEILTDNGAEFRGEVLRSLVLHGVSIRNTAPHMSQSNGLVENANRVIKTALQQTNEKAEEEEEEAAEEEIEEGDHLQYTEGEETPEEEESEAKSDDLDYRESEDAESEEASSDREESEEEEGGSGESSGPDELSREERKAVAQRKRATAEGKRPIEEAGGPPPQLLQGDPTLNPKTATRRGREKWGRHGRGIGKAVPPKK